MKDLKFTAAVKLRLWNEFLSSLAENPEHGIYNGDIINVQEDLALYGNAEQRETALRELRADIDSFVVDWISGRQ